MKKARFTSELIEGHKGVQVVIVPFDPEEVFGEQAIMIDARRHGWLVRGTINKKKLVGWIGDRWGRYFIMLDPALVKALKLDVGDSVSVVIEPTDSESALEIAREQAKLTTAPKKRRRAVKA